MNKVRIQDDGCWAWTGALFENGYGAFWDTNNDTNVRAHRAAYQLLRGAIPEGLELDHLCRVRHCVNPHHLEAVTRSENLRRSPLLSIAARKRALANPERMREMGRKGGRAGKKREDSSPTEGMRSSLL